MVAFAANEACLAPTWVPSAAPGSSASRGVGESASPKPFRPGTESIAVVDDRVPPAEQGTILRTRLAAATWVMLVPLIGLFLQGLWWTVPVSPWLPAADVTVVVGALVLLHGPRRLTVAQLRVIELALFGVLVVQFLEFQQTWLLHACVHQDAVQLTSVAGTSLFGFGVSILAYGMLMPNGWRRTAMMILPSALLPLLGFVHVAWLHPFAATVITPVKFAEAALMLGLSGGIAVLGTANIAQLRQAVRRAQRFGQYHLKQAIGHGGMGEIYLAEHQLLKRPCALKLIRPQQLADPLALERFEREVCSMARLSHQHTVDVYDYGHTADGTFYYVMEYLPGLNLAELVERFGPLPPERVIHFLQQTCAALAEAHRLGLVHRDLKPANIFAAERGGEFDYTKLLDFGLVIEDSQADWLAREAPEPEHPFAGSPLYMAPEQLRGAGAVDVRSDVYSLGATGYFLLTGRPPFVGTSPLRVMLAHATDPVTPPSQLRSGVPGDLERLLLKCLQKRPENRFENVEDLRHELMYCQDAGLWTAERAAAWWQAYAADSIAEPLCDGHYCGMPRTGDGEVANIESGTT